jgi:hypothetical protein
MNDEEIQERAQRGETVSGPDGAAYRKVFQALGREPNFKLPPSFADRVMHRALGTSRKSIDMLWFYTGLFACLVALIVAVLMSGFKMNLALPGFVRNYPGFVVFGILFVLGLQWLDRRLVRRLS